MKKKGGEKMARPAKPLELSTKHLTKEEIESRKKAEKMLQVDDKKVYKIPKKLEEKELKSMI